MADKEQGKKVGLLKLATKIKLFKTAVCFFTPFLLILLPIRLFFVLWSDFWFEIARWYARDVYYGWCKTLKSVKFYLFEAKYEENNNKMSVSFERPKTEYILGADVSEDKVRGDKQTI